MRRPAELGDRDRRGLTALPTTRWKCLLCGTVTFNIRDDVPCCAARASMDEPTPEAPMPPRRFARVRAASTATKFALLVAGVVLACLAVIAAAWAVGESWS
jgi:hypothetical protein